ncbi:MAG: hypothetical protein JWQ46_196 [Phenylobacterium sp.]|jgi:hypothetical protein|nr:hypothetical protein [Phenylobacterium sp.]
MRTFTCLTIDDRYPIPQLSFLMVSDETRARVLARRTLFEDKHRHAVEVREDGKLVFEEYRSEG